MALDNSLYSCIRKKFASFIPFTVRCNLPARQIGPNSWGPGVEQTKGMCVKVLKIKDKIDFLILFDDPVPVKILQNPKLNEDHTPIPRAERKTRLFNAASYITTCMWLNDVNGMFDPTTSYKVKPELLLQVFSKELQCWIDMKTFYDGFEDNGLFTEKSIRFSLLKMGAWTPQTESLDCSSAFIFNHDKVTYRDLRSSGFMWKQRSFYNVRTDRTTEEEFFLMEQAVFNKKPLSITIENEETSPIETKALPSNSKARKRLILHYDGVFNFLQPLPESETQKERKINEDLKEKKEKEKEKEIECDLLKIIDNPMENLESVEKSDDISNFPFQISPRQWVENNIFFTQEKELSPSNFFNF
jgi:hypothetical protein